MFTSPEETQVGLRVVVLVGLLAILLLWSMFILLAACKSAAVDYQPGTVVTDWPAYGATPGGDGQYAQDDQSHIDQAPPDGSVDGGSHDGSSSTWNQSSTNDDTNAAAAAGSQQVRVYI